MSGLEGFANPFAVTHRATVDEAHNEALDFGINKIDNEIESFQRTLMQVLDQGGDDLVLSNVTVFEGTPQEKAGKVVELNSKLSGYIKARNEKEALIQIVEGNAVAGDDFDSNWSGHVIQPAASVDHRWASRQMRSQFQEKFGEDKLSNLALSRGFRVDLEIPGENVNNTLFKRTAGWDPFVERESSYVPSRQRQVRLFDIIPISATDQSAIHYMEETLFGDATVSTPLDDARNPAAGGTEGVSSAPEAELKLVERKVPVEKYHVHIPVTEEQLDDVPEVDSYLNERLPYMLMLKTEDACVSGSGATPEIKGFFNQTNIGSYNLQKNAGGLTKPLHDILHACYQVKKDGFTMPDAVFLNLMMVKNIFLAESQSGGFYLGNPQTGFRPEVWGLPLVETHMFDYAAGNKIGLVGSFGMWSKLRIRRGYQLDIGVSNDDFLKGVLRIRATVRLVLVVYRPQAFCVLNWAA